MQRLRMVHGVLTYLFGILLVVQFFLAGLGAFTTVHNKKYGDNDFAAHGILGTALVVLALALMIVALMGRWSAWATRGSVILFGLMVLQFVLGVTGAGSSPVLGGLHAVNALLIAAATAVLVRQTMGAFHSRRSAPANPAL